MTRIATDAKAARIGLLSLALQEVARALSPAQAVQVADAVRQRVAAMAEEPMSPEVDEAVTAELAPLLVALDGR